MLTISSDNNLTKEEHKYIINKFPDKLKPFFKNTNNPLDETQILVNLFKDKDVRIILNKEENEFGIEDYVAYFHANDIYKTIKYDDKHISHVYLTRCVQH